LLRISKYKKAAWNGNDIELCSIFLFQSIECNDNHCKRKCNKIKHDPF